jgi:hypothetical protein
MEYGYINLPFSVQSYDLTSKKPNNMGVFSSASECGLYAEILILFNI